MRRLEESAAAFDRACRGAGVAYAFIGGVAVMAWGQPRATEDIDALVELDRSKVDRWVLALRAERFAVDPRDCHDSLSDGSHVTVHDEGSDFRVDVKLARAPLERDEVRRSADVAFGGGRLRVASAEDTIAFKLKFGSPQDLNDVRSILVRQAGRLDLARLRAVALQVGVVEQLKKMLASVR